VKDVGAVKLTKLIIAYIGQDCEKELGLSLKSVIDVADHIVFVDGGSKDGTLELLRQYPDKIQIIPNKYDKEDLKANGKARNIYLQYVQEKFDGDWCLVLDPDEVIDDIKKVRDILKSLNKDKVDIANVKMRHLMNFVNVEDASKKEHFVPSRLFKINKEFYYPEVEHSVLSTKGDALVINLFGCVIWHLGYARNLWYLKKRYEEHLQKSNMHTPEYLHKWYLSHIVGVYPVRKFDVNELPMSIKEEFLPEPLQDVFYFNKRLDLEGKHYHDAVHWKHFFKPKKVLSIGCGPAHREFVLAEFGIEVMAFDQSQYVINKSPYAHKNLTKWAAEVPDGLTALEKNQFDLSIAYDILEHLKEEDVIETLKELYKVTKHYLLISVPVIGDPNLEQDATHLTKKKKSWWESQIKKAGFKVVPTPDNFQYQSQIIIGMKIMEVLK